jgi:uncharacterized protein (DUF433 family)
LDLEAYRPQLLTQQKRMLSFDLSPTRAAGIMSELLDRITIDPEICHGKPCIRGLRYPVEVILELLAGGATTEDILRDYEDLERDDVLAALAFAARLAQVKRVQPPAA